MSSQHENQAFLNIKDILFNTFQKSGIWDLMWEDTNWMVEGAEIPTHIAEAQFTSKWLNDSQFREKVINFIGEQAIKMMEAAKTLKGISSSVNVRQVEKRRGEKKKSKVYPPLPVDKIKALLSKKPMSINEIKDALNQPDINYQKLYAHLRDTCKPEEVTPPPGYKGGKKLIWKFDPRLQ
jgi:hypothetical protein